MDSQTGHNSGLCSWDGREDSSTEWIATISLLEVPDFDLLADLRWMNADQPPTNKHSQMSGSFPLLAQDSPGG